jgi:hypothetical protein
VTFHQTIPNDFVWTKGTNQNLIHFFEHDDQSIMQWPRAAWEKGLPVPRPNPAESPSQKLVTGYQKSHDPGVVHYPQIPYSISYAPLWEAQAQPS